MILILVIGLLLLGAGLMLVIRGSTTTTGRNSGRLDQIESYGFSGRATVENQISSRPLASLANSLGTVAQRLIGTGEQGIRRQLLAAGMYDVDPTTVIGYRVLGVAVLSSLWLWLGLSGGFSGMPLLVGTVAVGGFGWMLPVVILSRRGRQRTEEIERELPELIDLLVVTLEAGISFLASLHLAAARLRGPLGEELRLVLQEQRMGLTSNDALQGMLRRAETPVLRTFVRAVVQGEQLGVSTGQIMRNLAIEMRKARRAKAEQRAQKAPLKMLFPLIFLIFPAMFIVILGPAYYTISENLLNR